MSLDPEAYVAGDRRRALAAGLPLPDPATGSALFADISGFTPLTEALVAEHGRQRGAEELSGVLDRLFDDLLVHLHRYDGSVVYFSGDAVTCWLEGDDGSRAAACALAMQSAMTGAGRVVLPSGRTVQLAMKVAVAVGTARRFVVGDPSIQLLDVLAGSLMDRLAALEQHAGAGEVLLDATAVRRLGDRARGTTVTTGDEACLRLERLDPALAPPTEPPPVPALPEAVVRSWLLPAVYERLRAGRGEFLAELRTAVPVFVRFGGLDFDRDPGAGAALDAFVVAVQRVVDGYGGSLLQITLGDKGAYLYAVFGTPYAHEDDAARACAAALELRALSSEHPVTDLQVGLSRGRVRSGTYGHRHRRTFCCLGDPVNLAARLMAAAPPGEVYASGEVRAEAAGETWEALPPLRVKGKAEPVQVHRLVGDGLERVATRHRRHTLPMVGRGEELAVLARHVVTTADGRGGSVVVAGGAGLGKSRLLVEAVRLLHGSGAEVHEGEAPAFGTRTAYRAWHDVWRGLLGLDRRATAEDQARQAEQRVTELDATLAARAPLLGAALGLPFAENELTASLTPELRKSSLEGLLVALLRALAADGRARGLLIEDAQWLDELSLDLLGALARGTADLPVLLLVAARPDEGDGGVDDLVRRTGAEEVRLPPLDDAASAEVCAAKLAELGWAGEVPQALLDLVRGRAEGNPFFLEELVVVVHASGVDARDPLALDALELPDSLQSLALSRVDTLAEGPRRTAKVASVLGRAFRTDMLRAVYPELGPEAEVGLALAELRRAGLVAPDPQPDGAEGHVFRHVVTAQAAYEATPVALREVLHAAAGRFVEALGPAATAARLDLLAYHFARSDAEEEKRRYLRLAGDRSRADFANAAAIDHYRRLAPLLDDAARPEVLLHLGEVQQLVGRWGEAEQSFEDARRRSEDVRDSRGVARARTALAENGRRQGRYEQAEELLVAADEAFAGLGDDAGRGEVLHLQGTLAAQQGRFDQARAAYEESLTIRRALGDDEKTAALLSNLGVIAEYSGDLDGADALNAQSLELRLRLGNRWAIGVSQNNLGMIALLQGRFADAAGRFTEAMRLQSEVGDAWMVAIAHNNLGNALRGLGELDAAAQELGAALSAYGRFEDRWALGIVLEDVARLAVRRGLAEAALRLVGAAETVRDELGSPRSPTQEEDLRTDLAPARTAAGADADALLEAGRRLDLEEAAALAAEACAA